MDIKTFMLLGIFAGLVTINMAFSLEDLSLAIKDADMCEEVLEGGCTRDSQCRCAGRFFICKAAGKCGRMTIQDIMSRQPCSKVFKRHCVKDEDCPCTTHRLVCEGNECVRSPLAQA